VAVSRSQCAGFLGRYAAGRTIEANSTRVTLDLDVEAETLKEKIGEKLGFVSKQVEGDLKRFKEFIESRGAETGAWRGRV
jgi:hypothetical protein